MSKMKNKPSQLRDILTANLTPLLMVIFALLTGFLIGQSFEANRKTATITDSTAKTPAQAEQSDQNSPSIVEEIAASVEGEAPLQLTNQNQNSAVSQSAAPSVSQTTSGKVNINSATQDQLETLKGIGPAKAKAIIDYRNQNGLFVSLDDLLKVKGIGPKTLENIKPYISI